MLGVSPILRRARSKVNIPDDSKRVVVIGGGMVGAHFCKEAARLGLLEKYEVTVIGDEPFLAYNRINLGDYVAHRSLDKLLLHPEGWYDENGVHFRIGKKAIAIDRENRRVEIDSGEVVEYDLLLLATGSRPSIPNIPGVDHPRVFTYRNLSDIKNIISHFKEGEKVAILGGGLLGIEAAHTFQKLHVETSIFQRANFLMTRQLNEEAASVLEELILGEGIQVHTKAQNITIDAKGDAVQLTINKERSLDFDHVIISVGITPNTEIAKAAGIECGIRGGVVVNDCLQTSDPQIFAIGECALLKGKAYGLAAPGFEMATRLAELLAGNKKYKFRDLDSSTRLKMSGVDVSVVGNALQAGNNYTYSEGGVYRLITVDRRKRVVGAIGIGKWDEYAELHHLFIERSKIKKESLKSFQKSGILFPDVEKIDPLGWEDSRVVCNCMSVSKGEIMQAVAKCGNDPRAVASETKASTVCGSCDYLVQTLCGKALHASEKPRFSRWLFGTSLVAFLIVAAAFILPPAPIADSVTSFWAKVDQLWRDSILKQITGYTMLSIFTLGLLVSLRKRIPWFTLGKYVKWRYFHVLFGVLSLVMLYAHTGFHFGHNLNFWLMLVFTLLNLFGAVTGIVIAMENTSHVALARFSQTVRPYMLWGHIVLFWPLPILLTFHILAAYKY